MSSDDVSTQDLKDRLQAWQGTLTDWILLTQAYHTSRLADAMERLADHLQNGQIATLREGDIVTAIENLSSRTGLL
jgi:hypothetical protein